MISAFKAADYPAGYNLCFGCFEEFDLDELRRHQVKCLILKYPRQYNQITSAKSKPSPKQKPLPQPVEEYQTADLDDRVKCEFCSRKFASDVYERHVPACKKLHTKKRPVFDSKRARISGTAIESYEKTKSSIDMFKPKPPNTPKQKTSPRKPIIDERPLPTLETGKKSSWKAKHEQFIKSIRAARTSQYPAVPDDEPVYDDKIECPHCSRRFDEGAADRHIPICKEKAAREKLRKPKTTPDKLESLKKRTQYKPPTPGRGVSLPELEIKEQQQQDLKKQYKRVKLPAIDGCDCCGAKYATPAARFCAECGEQRERKIESA